MERYACYVVGGGVEGEGASLRDFTSKDDGGMDIRVASAARSTFY